MGMAPSDNIDVVGKSSWPKWLLAVLIGAPVTFGIGYYYFRKKNHSKDEILEKNGTVRAKKNVNEVPDKGPSANEDTSTIKTFVPQTPLGKALSLKESGNQFYKSGKLEDAVRCYSEAISICPAEECDQLSKIYQNRAAAHELMNNMADVVQDCSRAIDLNPTYLKALSRRLKAAEKLGQLRMSLEDATALCILERFENINTLNHADRILKKIGAELAKEMMKTKPPITPSQFFVTSYLNTFVNDPITSKKDEDLPPALLKAKEALQNCRLDEVVEISTEQLNFGGKGEGEGSLEGTEERYLGLLLRSTAFLLSGRSAEAVKDLNRIIEDNPPYPMIVVSALVKRAAIHLQVDELEKCFEDFSKAESLDSTNADIFNQRAQVYLYSDRVEEASEDYDKVVQLSPDFSLGIVQRLYTRYRRAAASRDAEGMAEATAQLAAAAERRPETPEGFLFLGQVYADQQNFEAAKNAFDRARSESPQNASVLTHKGLLELQWHSDVDKAIEYLEEAIRVDSKCEFAYETLASIEVQRGNLVRAVELFSEALKLAKCEKEMSHILALKAAAEAQQVVAVRLRLPVGMGIRF